MTRPNSRITLNNGVALPALGLGVFQSAPADTVGEVEAAIKNGYRLIDTAAAYFNEREVGERVRCAGIPRDEVFIETKIWISDYGYDATLHAFELVATTGPASEDFEGLFGSPEADQPNTLDGIRDMANMPVEAEPQRVRDDLNALIKRD